MYQTRYLSGIVAGGQLALDENPSCVAYMAAFPIPQVIRQLNAFTLGCKVTFFLTFFLTSDRM